MNESPNNLAGQRVITPIVDQELADAIGSAISAELAVIERDIEQKLELKFEQKRERDLREFGLRLELSEAKAAAKYEAFVNEVQARRGRR